MQVYFFIHVQCADCFWPNAKVIIKSKKTYNLRIRLYEHVLFFKKFMFQIDLESAFRPICATRNHSYDFRIFRLGSVHQVAFKNQK